MKNTMKKTFSLVLALLMLVSVVPIGVNAATTISYSPNPKVEYSYSSGVTTGTIRYISQISGSTYFNSNYWGGWASQAGIECGTASISMALSYVGVNKTPKAILDAHSGITYFTGWGPSTSNPSVATGMSNYINGNGKYSPPIVHFTTGYSSGTHYVLLIGKVSSSSYLVLDPATNNTWTLSTSDAKYKSIDQVFQYYNASASITPDVQKPTISNVKITNVDFYGYNVTCTVSDNKGVTKVSFPTWSNYNGQDDIRWKDGTINGNTVTFRVDKADHNNENGTYTTDIYAYDAAGNYSAVYGYTAFVDAAADLQTTYNGTKYILYKASVCYNDAEKYCRSKGGYLAKITSAAENAAVAQLTKTYGSWCWINGSDNAQEGVWKFSTGEKISYTNWGSGEPNSYMGTDQDYIAMHPSGEWDDSAGLGYGFICEFDHTHSYTSKVTKVATCTATGTKTYICSCGASYTETIAKTAHNSNTTIAAVAATCTKTGLTEGKKCSVCGTVTVAQQTVAKKAHSYTATVTTQPTCSKDGVKTYKCSCGASYTEAISKSGHNWIPATCTTPKTCSKCGNTESSALGHNYGEPMYSFNISNYPYDTMTITCISCNSTETKTYTMEVKKDIPFRIGSDYIEFLWGPSFIEESKCEIYMFDKEQKQYVLYKKFVAYSDIESYKLEGLKPETEYSFLICEIEENENDRWGYWIAEVTAKTVPTAHNHSYTSYTTKPATLSANGKVEYTCSCGDTYTETIPKISSVTLSKENYIYDGKNKTPKVTVKDANGKTLVKNTDYKLTVASKRSGIGRYTVKVTFIGNYSGTKNVYFYIKTGKPATVKSASQTTSSVKLSWSAVSGAAGYTVYRYSPSKKAYVKAGTTEGTSLTVSKLYAGTKYTFRVVSYGKTSAGKVYDSDVYTLLKTATKTKTPELTKVTASSTKGKAYVYHTDVSGETGYTVYYSTKKDSGFKKYNNFKADTTRCDITGLTSGKTYYFKVRTYIKTDSGYVYSAWSAVKSVKVK